MMDGGRIAEGLMLDQRGRDLLMPMHLWLAPEGKVLSAGATLRKVLGADPSGQAVFDLFEFRRPVAVQDMAGLRAAAGLRLHLSLLHDPLVTFRALAAGLPGGDVLCNLSFGISIVEAVRRHALTEADFPATDLAVEMLYLVEAKSAVMEELRQLNLRLQGAKSAAEAQALTDTLTGLGNRRAFDAALERALAGGAAFSLIHLDLDFFKAVNDTMGHAAGDQVLRAVAEVLKRETRTGDTVARIGGDEFTLLIPGLSDPSRLCAIASAIIRGIAAPIPFQGRTCRVSASLGMTISSLYTRPEGARMIADADAALYAAKRAGRGRACLHGQSGAVACGCDPPLSEGEG